MYGQRFLFPVYQKCISRPQSSALSGQNMQKVEGEDEEERKRTTRAPNSLVV